MTDNDKQQQTSGFFSNKSFTNNTTSENVAKKNIANNNETNTIDENITPKNSENNTHNTNIEKNTYRKQSTLAIGEPLKLAVVGHTNTGKTSILRTLLRDTYFGEIKNSAATTRHVERAIITDTNTEQSLVTLFDTPGLEDASGVMDWLEENTSGRCDGVDRLQKFLASDCSKALTDKSSTEQSIDDNFSQEAKVIRQLLGSDMAIYVIDAREPVLGKYKDELTILSWSAIPIMPVFNFTNHSSNNINAWQEMLKRRNLHISTLFDSVAFEFNDELVLWKNLSTMLTDNTVLTALIDSRQNNWRGIYDEAHFIIADFLLNVASFVREIDEDDDPLPTLHEMKEAVRQAERAMHQKLLDLYKFYDSAVSSTALDLNEYQQDPFDSEVLKSYGIRTSSGAVAGALVGMSIDAAALGTTLGLGTALGGLVGGVLSNTSTITDIIRGKKRLFIDPATLTLLATRVNVLHNKLRHRGHATNNKNITTESELACFVPWKIDKIPSLLKKARNKPHWSSLSGAKSETTLFLRHDAATELSKQLTITLKDTVDS